MSNLLSQSLPPDPLAALAALAAGEAELDRLRHEQVAAARVGGATWQQIGDALGTSRQSAWETFATTAQSILDLAAERPGALSEDEALELAVGEVRAVRQRRSRG